MAYTFEPFELQEYQNEFPKLDKDTVNGYYRADVIDGKFTENYGGWPRNDIALINEQTSLEAAKVMLDNLTTLPENNGNAGLSDFDIMLSHKSKYCQSPSEVTSWIENQLALRDSKRQTSGTVEDVVKDGTIKFEDNETN